MALALASSVFVNPFRYVATFAEDGNAAATLQWDLLTDYIAAGGTTNSMLYRALVSAFPTQVAARLAFRTGFHVTYYRQVAAQGAQTSGSTNVVRNQADSFVNPALADTDGVHVRHEDNVSPWAGVFTSPAIPRNITMDFEAAWAGGDVTVTGTDQFGAAQNEVIADNPGGQRVGIRIFATVTGATNELAGAGGVNHGATIGWGNKLGLSALPNAAVGSFTCDGVNEVGTWDATRGGVTPTTAPDGAHDYVACYPLTSGHTHASAGGSPALLVDPNIVGGVVARNFRLDLTTVKGVDTATATFLVDVMLRAAPHW